MTGACTRCLKLTGAAAPVAPALTRALKYMRIMKPTSKLTLLSLIFQILQTRFLVSDLVTCIFSGWVCVLGGKIMVAEVVN